MPSLHFTTQQTRELKRELADLERFISYLHAVTPSYNAAKEVARAELVRYLELRRDTIEQKLARLANS